MRSDFCVFILTHGRPDRVYTARTLERSGYTGRTFFVVDDEDKTAQGYRDKFGKDRVLTFSKGDIAKRFDEADNFNDRRSIFYARNACFDLARKVGCRFFMQLDDDYTAFHYRHRDGSYGPLIRSTMDKLLDAMISFMWSTPALTVAMSQGGDHIGGSAKPSLRRKAMNTFICCVDRPFAFTGRINEDVNTYTTLGRRGELFLTVMQTQMVQRLTQQNSGGMSDLYLDAGTYVKSFYSVMHCPSSVKIGELVDHSSKVLNSRVHHRIAWNATAPCILDERHVAAPNAEH